MGWMWSSSLLLCFILVGCAGTSTDDVYGTPTVDYVEGLNVNDAPHQESFLNQLAMNYRSYALYNARTSGHPDVAELFAQKAISAFSGEFPYPENLDNWEIYEDADRFEIYTAYNNLMEELRNDAALAQPQLAAEAQAKFDCWISAAASGQMATAQECEDRFLTTMEALKNCDRSYIVVPSKAPAAGEVAVTPTEPAAQVEERYYPETRRLSAVSGVTRSRDGIMIINNVNVPSSNLVQPVPVPRVEKKDQSPIVFNQTINGGSDTITNNNSCGKCSNGGQGSRCNRCQEKAELREHDGYVTREEFIDLMMSLRAELADINARLDYMDGRSASAPVSVPVSVQVTTPATQNIPMQGQAPVIVNTTTPAPLIVGNPDGNNQPIVINASASTAPVNVDVSNSTASKTEPVNVDVSNSTASKTEPVNVDVSNSTASKTEPVNVDINNASASKTDPVNVGVNSTTSSKTDPVSVNNTSAAKTDPVNVGLESSLATAPSPVNVNTPVTTNVPTQKPDKTVIKVQQIPLEPRQRIMEEIFEIRFDFDKATIKPEYENIIRQLAAATQANKNMKVSVVGHTDTAGSSAYNYALGGRRAEAVQKMLIAYGIPASQIIAVSAGEEDLKIPTPNNTPNADNRRVRVVKEVQYTEQPQPAPVMVEEYSEIDDCDECGY